MSAKQSQIPVPNTHLVCKLFPRASLMTLIYQQEPFEVSEADGHGKFKFQNEVNELESFAVDLLKAMAKIGEVWHRGIITQTLSC